MSGDPHAQEQSKLEAFISFSARRPLLALILIGIISGLSVFGVLDLKIDTSYDSLISEKDPEKIIYNETIKQFGSDNTTVVYVKDPNLFDPAKLLILEETIQKLRDLEAVERVDSLFSVVSIRDQDGILDSRPLMDIAPETREEAEQIKSNAIYSPLVRNNLLSEDGTATAINITVLRDFSDERFNAKMYERIEEAIKVLRSEFSEVFQVGPPRLNVDIEVGMFEDLSVLTPLSTLVLVAFIILIVRLPIAAAIPMVTAGLSIILTFGFMGYMGIELTLLTAIVPSLIIVIGSTEDMHLVAAYLEGVPSNSDKTIRKKAVNVMVRHIGLAIILTAFTTSVGFLSNATNEIPLIRDFAYASSFAMVANFVVTLLTVPLMLTYFGPTKNRLHGGDHGVPKGPIGVLIRVVEALVTKFRVTVVAVIVVLMGAFGYFATGVHVSNDPLSYFPPDHPLVTNANTLHTDLSGMQIFYVTLDSDQPEAFRDPAILAKLDRIQKSIEQSGGFDKVISLGDHLALVNQEMNQGNPDFWRQPETRELVDQYILMFQRRDLERYVTSDYQMANIVVRHNISDSHVLNQYLDKLRAEFKDIAGDDFRVFVTGENLMINKAAESLFSGQVESLILIGAIIFVMMSFLYVSFFAGFMFLIPNLFPLILNFGTMALLGIPLNPGTASVAAIALGIAVDDSIHLFSRFRAEVRATGQPEQAIKNTVRGEAVAVVTTSLSLMAMYASLLASNFEIVDQFGLLAGLTMVYALIADLVITPIVLRRVGLVGVFEILSLKLANKVVNDCILFEGMNKFQAKKTILLSKVTEFKEGDEIIVEGTIGRDMYVILEGAVDVVVGKGDQEKMIARLTPGEVFGEVGFIGETKRLATVRCRSDVQVLALNAEAVAQGLSSQPKITSLLTTNISRLLSERMIDINQRDGKQVASIAPELLDGSVLEIYYDGETFVMEQNSKPIRIGRADDNEVMLKSEHISRTHAEISVIEGRFTIKDESATGTYLRHENDNVETLKWTSRNLADEGTISFGPGIDGREGEIRFKLVRT